MSTAEAVSLADVCERLFGLSYEEARRRAATQSLPVPTFRLAPSQKAPLMIHRHELERLVDQAATGAREQWAAINGVPSPGTPKCEAADLGDSVATGIASRARRKSRRL